MTTTTTPTTTAAAVGLSPIRLHLLRGAYLMIGIGLMVVKWPLLPDAATLPLYEGVTLCLLTALSLLAFLGVWRPVRMLPVLLFESLWKLLWLALVALPRALAGDVDPATSELVVSCSLVVVILAVVPWRHVWHQYLATPGDRWRS